MSDFTKIVTLRDVENGPVSIRLEADAHARSDLAQRFDLIAIDHLSGQVEAQKIPDGIRLEGVVTAQVTQKCAISLDPVESHIEDRFAIRFLDAPLPMEADEMVVDVDEEDVDILTQGAVDVAEILAQTVSLALDPFPRAPGVDLPPIIKTEAQVKADAEAQEKADNPFADLKKLYDKLEAENFGSILRHCYEAGTIRAVFGICQAFGAYEIRVPG
ncbi:DNA-binding protein [Iodidimonas gelatinilytica]|uniref:DNA-binding protein n=1 Tax=Iodidimonas gelatinilytica TaxID=1236966 RepID=A0A5A7MXM2_9PROT|nr:DUF177 domain-containing protein [Iodidimonas gelatinilytica]GER00712.1 DNA-binding protein [Iodidimonas gelatinilytica]